MQPWIIILIITLYLFIGLWICAKRDWYDNYTDGFDIAATIFGTLLMPLNLMIVFIKEFCVREWDNQNT